MSRIVAVAGKGGTGKTTIAGLLIRYLVKTGKTPVLAVDADADSNLPGTLGIATNKNLGVAREDFFKKKGEVPAGIPKEAYLELKLNEVLVESRSIDLLVMGRPEGPGCYCYINNILRKYLEVLSKNYPFVIIDNEAGMEHLSRRIVQDIDTLIVVSDYSLNGLRAAQRIKQLSEELDLKIKSPYLIVNEAPSSLSPRFLEEIEKTRLPLAGAVPKDDLIPQYEIEKKSLRELPDSSRAVSACNEIGWAMFSQNE